MRAEWVLALVIAFPSALVWARVWPCVLFPVAPLSPLAPLAAFWMFWLAVARPLAALALPWSEAWPSAVWAAPPARAAKSGVNAWTVTPLLAAVVSAPFAFSPFSAAWEPDSESAVSPPASAVSASLFSFGAVSSLPWVPSCRETVSSP